MKIRILTMSALGFVVIASAANAKKNANSEPINPIGDNDLNMTCTQLSDEADAMEAISGSAPALGVFNNNQVADIGTDLATDMATDKARSGVLKAGLGGRAAGAVGRLGGLAKSSRKQRAKANEARKQSAQERWYYIAGLYQGRACDLEPEQPAEQPAMAD